MAVQGFAQGCSGFTFKCLGLVRNRSRRGEDHRRTEAARTPARGAECNEVHKYKKIVFKPP